MNCLITQAEIEALGYTLEELTQDKERTEQFLNLLLQKGKEVLGMQMDSAIQSFYGAFLPGIPGADAEEEGPVLTYQIIFPTLDSAIRFCTIFGAGKAEQSRLYEEDKLYYLMVDFPNTEEGRKCAQGIVSAAEFGGVVEKDAISELYLKEHERNLIEEHAVEKLCEMDSV